MKKAKVLMQGKAAGMLEELEPNRRYRFSYFKDYAGPPISLTLPVADKEFEFDTFPAFFDGLLPEGLLLEGLLKLRKLDKYDYFGQLIAVGEDLVGAITVQENNG